MKKYVFFKNAIDYFTFLVGKTVNSFTLITHHTIFFIICPFSVEKEMHDKNPLRNS